MVVCVELNIGNKFEVCIEIFFLLKDYFCYLFKAHQHLALAHFETIISESKAST